MTSPLSGRIAIVTGASRGIGAATSLGLAKAGAHVVATARDAKGLEEIATLIRAAGGAVTVSPLDIKSRDGIEQLAAEVGRQFGKLDILIANAGVLGTTASAHQIDPAAWDDLIAVNLTANIDLIRAMHPWLTKSDAGRVVFITSGIAWRGRPHLAAYAASKAALNAVAQAYAAENVDKPLRVNMFSPGATQTDLFDTAFPGTDPSTLATPEAVAEKIVAASLPSLTETGKVYEFRERKWLSLRAPA